MINALTDLDSKRYGELLSKQFISIAREHIISNEKAWQIFLKQPDAAKISEKELPTIKKILYGQQTLNTERLIREITDNNHCQLIPVLFTMCKGKLSADLVKESNIIVAKVLAIKD